MEMRHPLPVILVVVLILSPMIVVGDLARIAPHDTGQRASPDPSKDTIGWEGGYWYNESIDIDQTNGLSGSELDAFLGRSMARVEHIRNLEFTERVTIEFVRREELDVPRNDNYGLSTSEQLWEVLFLYGEQTDASRTVKRSLRSVVLGYAAEEGSDHIVIVDPTPRKPTVSGGTLIHELAHMLQDQHFNLGRSRYQRHTLDGEFAKDGLVEGAASYITAQYVMNCQDTWRCIDAPSSGSSVSRPAPFRFYRLTSFPYSAGETYVRALIKQNGWKAVTAAHENPPVSTEQVIHPTRNDQSIPISFTSTARNGWTRADRKPETIGEVGINTLFFRQSDSSGGYDYASRSSTGWGNDRLYAYTNGNKRGYVWKTVWDTERDAREFREAYIALLKTKGATQNGPHTWRIENGAFEDAFSIRRTGNSVTIVNGPTIAALNDIHPAKNNRSDITTKSNSTVRMDETPSNTTTATTGPGFSGLVALVAVVLTGIGIRNRD